jgi:hypothetical protein
MAKTDYPLYRAKTEALAKVDLSTVALAKVDAKQKHCKRSSHGFASGIIQNNYPTGFTSGK